MRAVVLPVKSFGQAKVRLGTRLDHGQREKVARYLAEVVLRSAGDVPTFVACDDERVAEWALKARASVLWTPGLGLSGAVTEGVRRLGSRGFDFAVVAHADLPFAHDLDRFGHEGVVTIAPDRHLDGTNVVALPIGTAFTFSYGPGSFRRHQAEAERIGATCTVIDDWRLATDVDVEADLDYLEQLRVSSSLEGRDRSLLDWLDAIPRPAATLDER